MITESYEKPGFRFSEGDIVTHPDFPSIEFIVIRPLGNTDYEMPSYRVELRQLNLDGSYNPEGKVITVTDSGKFFNYNSHIFMPQVKLLRKKQKVFI